MAFHEVLFPVALSFGSSGGPERRTEIIALASGHEERNALWAHSRRRYDAGLGLRGLDDLHAVLAFFEARMGRLHGFRWRDPVDCKSCRPSGEPAATDCPIGVGDGETATFQLAKRYGEGAAAYDRPILKPVAHSVRMAVDGVEVDPSALVVDAVTGLAALPDPAPAGAAVTAGFVFDTPVRFDTDRIEVDLTAFAAGEIPSIPVVEVRLR